MLSSACSRADVCMRTTFFSAKICQMASSSCRLMLLSSSLISSIAACLARSGHSAAGRFRNAEQAAPVVAGSIEQLRRQGHGRKLREIGGPAGELAPTLDQDGAVAVDQMLGLLFPGRLVQRQRETTVLQGLGENFEPRESNAREGVELDGYPAPVSRRDRPDDVGRPPTVAAVEDGEQVGAAVLVDDVVGLVDEHGRARRVDDAEDRRGRDRTGEDRVGREVLDTFEQG